MRARKMVDPSDTSNTHRYTYLAEDYEQRIEGDQVRYEEIEAALEAQGMVLPGRKPGDASSEQAQLPTRVAAAVIPPSKPVISGAVTPPVKPVSAPQGFVKSGSATTTRGAAITDVRIGQHPDKTRIVLDASANANFEYQMDEQKNVLVVKLHGVRWAAAEKRVFSSHPLLLAYLAKPLDDGGTLLAIKMKQPAKLLFKSILPPAAGKSFRIVFDVAPA